MNRDIINGSIENGQSLNKYSYVQGNPVTLTDPFGLCPEGGGTNEELQLSKHTLLDIAGCIPVIGWMFDLANAVSYIQEKNYTAALISALSALPGIGNLAGSALKLGSKVVKGYKIAQTAEKAADICRTIGAAGNVAANTVALGAATNVAIKEYKSTGKISAGTMLNVADILETIGMIREENLDIRTITMGISLYDCQSDSAGRLADKIYDKIMRSAANLVRTGEDIEKRYGIPKNETIRKSTLLKAAMEILNGYNPK